MAASHGSADGFVYPVEMAVLASRSRGCSAVGAYSETSYGEGTGAAYVYRILDEATSIPTGNGVMVSAGDVTLRFSQVTVAGALEITRRQPTHPVPPNKRWVAGGGYDIHPTAEFNGPVEVTVAF